MNMNMVKLKVSYFSLRFDQDLNHEAETGENHRKSLKAPKDNLMHAIVL